MNSGSGQTADRPIQEITTIGLVLGLSMAFVEILAISVAVTPPGFSSLAFIVTSLAATTVIFFLAFTILGWLLTSTLGRLFRLATVPLALSLAVLMAAFYILVFVAVEFPVALSKIVFFKLLVLFVFSLATASGAYFAVKSIEGSFPRHLARLLSFALPVVLAETAMFAWAYAYGKIVFFRSVPLFLNLVLFGLVVLGTIALLRHLARRSSPAALLAPLAVIVALSPVVAVFIADRGRPSEASYEGAAHPVRHVILVTDDTLRPDHLSAYNEHAGPTPNIDLLAGDGTLFTNAIAPSPWTLPSVASIMTGLSPSVHTATGQKTPLPNEVTTLAEYMREAGYHTAAVGDNKYCTSTFKLDQGFIDFNVFPKLRIDYTLAGVCLRKLFPGRYESTATTDDLTRFAVEWLESNHSRPFFLWLHYFDPHLPYEPPEEFMLEGQPSSAIGTSFDKLLDIRGGYFVPTLEDKYWIEQLYAAEVRYVDANIGVLIDTLKRLSIYDESLIIFTSDHGEEFWEHGGFEHGHALYNELLRVPLIIKPPRSTATRRVDTVVSLQHILPTVLGACEIRAEYNAGGLLRPPGRGSDVAPEAQPVVSGAVVYYEEKESVIVDGFKYIRSLASDRAELFDLARDPDETRSIASSFPGIVDTAKRILDQHGVFSDSLRTAIGIPDPDEIELDEEFLEHLRSLGYVR